MQTGMGVGVGGVNMGDPGGPSSLSLGQVDSLPWLRLWLLCCGCVVVVF